LTAAKDRPHGLGDQRTAGVPRLCLDEDHGCFALVVHGRHAAGAAQGAFAREGLVQSNGLLAVHERAKVSAHTRQRLHDDAVDGEYGESRVDVELRGGFPDVGELVCAGADAERVGGAGLPVVRELGGLESLTNSLEVQRDGGLHETLFRR
jgi:hypothetical protein